MSRAPTEAEATALLVRIRLHGWLHHVDPEKHIPFWMRADNRHPAGYHVWEDFINKHENELRSANK